MAETSSLLNCRTGYRTGGSNPPLTAEVDEKKAVELVRTAFFSSTSAKPAARRAGMCDRREQIPQVRGYHSRFAPKPAAHFTVHNGSKSRDSVPLRNLPAECAASTGLLKRGGLSDPSHNGSKPRDSVPLRNPRPGRLLDVRMTAPTFPTFSTAFACGTWFAIGESDYICRAIK